MLTRHHAANPINSAVEITEINWEKSPENILSMHRIRRETGNALS